MGRVIGAWGVKGWVRVKSYTRQPEDLLTYLPWYLGRGDHWQATEILEGRPHRKGLVARLAGYDDRDMAERLAGVDIGIYRRQLPRPEQNEYYWNDLVGLQVSTLEGRVLGSVDSLLETGANDVLVVKGDRERLIPFIQGPVIAAVDLDAGLIRVDWNPDD